MTEGRPRPACTVLATVTLLLSVGACVDREPTYAPLRHPFRGAALAVDQNSQAADWQRAHGASWLDPITGTPQAWWLTGPRDITGLAALLERTRRQGALPVLVAYHIPNLDCAGPGHGAAHAGAYTAWVEQIVAAARGTRAAIVLEPDAVAAECFDTARGELLSAAVARLADAGHYVYLDAGHPRWRPAEEMAQRLHAAGIARAEGFAVNVSNRQSTADSHRYAVSLSTLVGDREAVIDTSRNGLQAPPADQWCNPARQGLGERPTTDPGLDRVAALLWVKRPGESDGPCGGGPQAGAFTPRQAQALIVNAPWVPGTVRAEAAQARLPGSW